MEDVFKKPLVSPLPMSLPVLLIFSLEIAIGLVLLVFTKHVIRLLSLSIPIIFVPDSRKNVSLNWVVAVLYDFLILIF